MPSSFVCAAHLRGSLETRDAARSLAGALPALEKHGLEPMEVVRPAWHEGSALLFGGTSLIHRAFSSRSGNQLWGAGFMVIPAPDAQATIITMVSPAEPLGAPGDAWDWVTR